MQKKKQVLVMLVNTEQSLLCVQKQKHFLIMLVSGDTSRVCVCVQNGKDWKVALRMFGEMRREGHQPQATSYAALLACLADHGQANHCLQIFKYNLAAYCFIDSILAGTDVFVWCMCK